MTRWVVLSGPAEDAALDNLVRACSAIPGVRSCSAGPDLPGAFGGIGMSWDLDLAVPDPSRIRTTLGGLQPELVPLKTIASRQVTKSGRRVKRTLLLTVRSGTPAEVVSRFEADLTGMPEHISTIRSWALSHVDASLVDPTCRWTHAFEQEFDAVEGLTGEYLLHPYHWTRVDRWFDSEIPDSIVEPHLAHVYRWAEGPILR